MKNWVDCLELLGEVDGEGVGPRGANDFEWSQVFLQEFLGGVTSSKVLCLDVKPGPLFSGPGPLLCCSLCSSDPFPRPWLCSLLILPVVLTGWHMHLFVHH